MWFRSIVSSSVIGAPALLSSDMNPWNIVVSGITSLPVTIMCLRERFPADALLCPVPRLLRCPPVWPLGDYVLSGFRAARLVAVRLLRARRGRQSNSRGRKRRSRSSTSRTTVSRFHSPRRCVAVSRDAPSNQVCGFRAAVRCPFCAPVCGSWGTTKLARKFIAADNRSCQR